MNKKLQLLILMMIPMWAWSQTTIWEDDFSLSSNNNKGWNGSSKNISGVDGWDITYDSDAAFWKVNGANDRFLGKRLTEEATWTKTVDISCYSSASVSITIGELGGMEGSDYITAEYSTNGINWTGVTKTDDFPEETISGSNITGDSLYLRIKAKNNATNERHYFKNVLVAGTSLKSLSIQTATAANVSSCSAEISALNNASCQTGITDHGIVYGTSSNPTTAATKRSLGSNADNISNLEITGLSASTTYYARAYVIKNGTTSYGGQVSFATGTPSYSTGASSISNISYNSATVSSTNTTAPCYTVSEKGIVYSTSSNPTTADNKVTDNSTNETISASLTGLIGTTKYYVRSYMTVNGTTTYGAENDFTTTKTVIWQDDFANETGKGYSTKVSANTTNVDDWSITNNNNADYWYVNNNGVFQGVDLDGTATWTTSSINIACFDGVEVSIFFPQSSNNDNSDYIKAEYSTNNGTNWTQFFNRNNDVPNGGETGTVQNISGNELLVRVSAYNDRNDEYYYFSNVVVKGTEKGSSATDVTVSSVSSTGASLAGSISLCGVSATDKGFVYGTTEDPTTSNNKVSLGSATAGTSSISQAVTSLSSNTTYYVRAYYTVGGVTYYSASSSSFYTASSSNKATIWSDDFANESGSGWDGSSTNLSGVTWTISNYSSADEFAVRNDSKFWGENTGDVAVWTSEVIDISCYVNVDLSVSIGEGGRLESGDFIKVEYKVGTGNWTTFSNNGLKADDFGSSVATQTNLNGASVQIRVSIDNDGSERHNFSNITVKGIEKTDAITLSGISDISSNSFNANVSFFNCGSITEKGIVVNTSGTPTTSDSKYSAGTAIEGFTVVPNDLSDSTKYYVRAYYTVGGTTTYSNEVSFFTAPKMFPLMISEYGLSTGLNPERYLELTNKSTYSVNLVDYAIVTFFNGANQKSGTNKALELSNQVLKPGESYVISYSTTASTALSNKADLNTSNDALSFDGNDAIVLYNNSINGGLTISSGVVTDFGQALCADIFGKVGQNSNWSNGNKTTLNTSLIRGLSTYEGVKVNVANFNLQEWEKSNFGLDSLGTHYIRLNTSITNSTVGKLKIKRLVANGASANDNISLTGKMVVETKLKLSLGDVELNSHDLVANSAALSHGNSSSYIKINNSGRLKTKVASNNSNVINPIGRNPYLPVVINCVDCDGVEFDFGVTQNVYPDPTSPTTAITSSVVGETWEITPSATFTSDITITVQWPSTRELSSFDRTNSMLSYWQGGTSSQWQKQSTTSSAQNGNESGTYTQTITLSGMTGGDTYYFGVGSNGSALPVEFGELTASLVGGQAQIEWVTLMEENNDYFEVQRSQDMINWEVVDVVAGAGTTFETNYYVSYDSSPLNGVSYYRIKQVDYNGEFDYSKAVSVETSTSVEIALYPNPTIDFVNINTTERLNLVQVYNTAGVLVLNTDFSSNRIDLKGLTAGVYTVVVSGNFGTKQFRLLKQ